MVVRETEWMRIKPTVDRIFMDKIREIWFSKIHSDCETFTEFENRCLNFPSLNFISEVYHKVILKNFWKRKELELLLFLAFLNVSRGRIIFKHFFPIYLTFATLPVQ